MSSPSVSGRPTMNLDELIDGQKIRTSAIVFLAIATLSMIADGFDISAISFIAPELIKQWHIAPKELVPVFSAGVFGLLFGAPLFGYVGDRFGRKRAVIIILSLVGALTLATMAANSLNQFVVLRFLTGLGLGGLIPNVIALAAEVAPKRRRGVFVIIVNFGVAAGFALPGWVAAVLVPQHGWPVLLLIGGTLALLVAVLVGLFLNESIRFLVQAGDRKAEVNRLARLLRPDLTVDPRTVFVTSAQTLDVHHNGSPMRLFAGGLAVLTPILWIVLAANQFANFFTLSWLPTLLQASGSTTAQAGADTAMYSVGGLVGGGVLMFLVDRFGVFPIVALFLMGVPIIASVGSSHIPPTMLGAIIACAGFCVTGNNFGMSAILGMIYPTPLRSKGAGWAQAFGRFGALGAQIAGGALLARHLPLREVFLAPALSLVVGAAGSGFLAVLCYRRFGGSRLDEAPTARTKPNLIKANLITPARPVV